LYAVKALTGMGLSLRSPYRSIYQNCFGLVFKMFGNSVCSCALLILHVLLKVLKAALVFSCFFPYYRLMSLYVFFASLHIMLNQGARCLVQRLGFLYCLIWIAFTTPAYMASWMRNSSTRLVLSSLSSWYWSVISLNFVAKVAVEVCAFQFLALYKYSRVSSPPIH
jgi:hypothetical protein